jgi:hypothetical protein
MEKAVMPVFRETADGSGFLQETTGDQMAPMFSAADGCSSSSEDAGQGGFFGAPTVTIISPTIVSTKRASTNVQIKTI